MSTRTPERESDPIRLQFEDNRLLARLYGDHDKHLARIEQQLGVELTQRGNHLAIYGPTEGAATAREAITALYRRLKKGKDVDMQEVDAAVRLAARGGDGPDGNEVEIATKKRTITPRSPTQADYVKALQEFELVFGLGPAGTGKTYLAVATAVAMLTSGKVDRIILSRPAVEAGERLGFLPGDLREKVDPYLRPLYDALYDMLPADQVARRLAHGEIEIAPLAFMRGRTLANSFVILDEAQNTTPVQMKMFLTRLGENSRMAVTGDLTQIDLPLGARSGLTDAIEVLEDVKGITFVRFTDADVVRHSLVTRVVRAYDAKDRRLVEMRKPAKGEGARRRGEPEQP
ncbi:MAG TPA: PhoH family protein [Alphaproteobacteria bacterium]|nr:PhoH family protein [Alphaproteobacteria bacterium]